jgi:hypothetical protein
MHTHTHTYMHTHTYAYIHIQVADDARHPRRTHTHAQYIQTHTAIPIIIEGRFQAFQRFSSSKLVLKTVESCFMALNYYGNGSTFTYLVDTCTYTYIHMQVAVEINSYGEFTHMHCAQINTYTHTYVYIYIYIYKHTGGG